jgi:hypothetical protein
MSKAYQFPHDPKRPNPFADSGAPTVPAGDQPYAAPAGPQEDVDASEFYQAVPHRGVMLLLLGIFGLVGVFLSGWAGFYCLPLGLVNLGLTIPAWIMGRGDLKAIRRGAMDASGRGMTQAAWILGFIGTGLSILAGLVLPIARIVMIAFYDV